MGRDDTFGDIWNPKAHFFSYGGYITLNIAIIDDVQQDLDTLGRAAQNYYEDRQIMVQIQSFSSPAAFWKALTADCTALSYMPSISPE